MLGQLSDENSVHPSHSFHSHGSRKGQQNLDGLIRKLIKPNSSHHSEDGHVEPTQEIWSLVFKDYDQEETFAPEIALPMEKIRWT